LITLCLNIFADLVSLRSISISFHNLGNIADGELSKFLFKTRSSLYDFVLFGSAKDLNIFWKEEGMEGFNFFILKTSKFKDLIQYPEILQIEGLNYIS